MPDAVQYREQAARVQRLLNASIDPLTRERLSALAEEYLAKADALEGGTVGSPPEMM
ncbi:MAG TPA: hypothetical protein VGM00_01830 [Bradyrhizobium sp.]|jgi:hypothetical protein